MKLQLRPNELILMLWLLMAMGNGAALADDGKDHPETGLGQTLLYGSQADSGPDSMAPAPIVLAADDDGQFANKVGEHELTESPEKEQEEVRQAVATGKAVPLTRLLQKLKTDYPGQVLDVALVRQPPKLQFVVKYIDRTGLVKVVSLDALTLESK